MLDSVRKPLYFSQLCGSLPRTRHQVSPLLCFVSVFVSASFPFPSLDTCGTKEKWGPAAKVYQKK